MGSKQIKQQTILELWNQHCLMKTNQERIQDEYQMQSPEIMRKNAILVLEQAIHSQHLESYKEEMKKFLNQMNPQQYAGQLALLVYLNHAQVIEFAIPQVDDKKEEHIYKQIVNHHLIKDLMEVWSEIFKQKYQIFLNKEMKCQLNSIIESKDFVYKSLCNDINYFIDYLEQLLKIVYKVINIEKFKQLLIKLIIQNKNVKKIILYIFDIYSQDKTERFQKKLYQNQNITLNDLKCKYHNCDFQTTIMQLKQILETENPCDKFDLFSKLSETMVKDLIDNGYKDEHLELDQQVSIIVFCIIQTQTNEWISQMNLIQMFLGQEIQYNYDRQSLQFTTVLSSIEYIMIQL